MSIWQLTGNRATLCFVSAEKRVRSFTDCILMTLNVNDDEGIDLDSSQGILESHFRIRYFELKSYQKYVGPEQLH